MLVTVHHSMCQITHTLMENALENIKIVQPATAANAYVPAAVALAQQVLVTILAIEQGG